MGSGAGSPVDATTARSSGMSDLAVPTFLPEVVPAVEVGWRFTPSVWGHGQRPRAQHPSELHAPTAFGYSHTVSVPTTGRSLSRRWLCPRCCSSRSDFLAVAGARACRVDERHGGERDLVGQRLLSIRRRLLFAMPTRGELSRARV